MRKPWILGIIALGAIGFLVVAVPHVISYSSGAGSCTYPSPGAMSPSQVGTGNFVVEVEDGVGPVTEYLPGETYTVRLRRTSGPGYRGYLLQSVAGSPGSPSQNGVGAFTLAANSQHGPCAVAASSVTHTSARRNSLANQDEFSWTAPAEGTGDVTFHAVGVVARAEWYGQETLITTTLAEDTATGSPVPGATLKVEGMFPNPSNPRTVLALEVFETGPVTVQIHDARGRLVRRLSEGSLERGRQEIAFDGKDDAGDALPSGVYFYRVEATGTEQTGKFALVR